MYSTSYLPSCYLYVDSLSHWIIVLDWPDYLHLIDYSKSFTMKLQCKLITPYRTIELQIEMPIQFVLNIPYFRINIYLTLIRFSIINLNKFVFLFRTYNYGTYNVWNITQRNGYNDQWISFDLIYSAYFLFTLTFHNLNTKLHVLYAHGCIVRLVYSLYLSSCFCHE